MSPRVLLLFVATTAASASTAAANVCVPVGSNTALAGNLSIAYLLVDDAAACCDACAAAGPLCAAFTWLPPTGAAASAATQGRCYLKTAATGASFVQGAVSGMLVGAQQSACSFGSTPCPGGSGACALFASWCASASCGASEEVCPDGQTCVPQSAGWRGCPNLPAYLDASRSAAERAKLIVDELTLDEIAPQLNNQGYGSGPPGPPGIPRLAIPSYNWLNEGLHGVARAGLATSFPQISVVGNTFNRSVFAGLGRILGSEARAKYAMDRRGNSTTGDYTGVTFYAPNINIGRDGRWGRIQEVVSECPFVTREYALTAVTASQGPVDDGSGSSTSAISGCCKHMVSYSYEGYQGIARNAQNAIVSGRDLLETYLPAFQSCIRDARGSSLMCSYNAVNGVPTCASSFLLNVTARQRYNLSGWIMSDYSAVGDTYGSHHYCGGDKATCVALALKVGVDQDGGGTDYAAVPQLVSAGLLTDAEVRTAALRLFKARLELGLLDAPQVSAYSGLAAERFLDTDANRFASYDAARQGMVLLKNNGSLVLPWSAASLAGGTVAVVGPNGDNKDVLFGNYEGTPPYLITPREGLVAALPSSTVKYATGCLDVACANASGFASALVLAQDASTKAVVAVFGLDQGQEAEGHDRLSIDLPGLQTALIMQLSAIAATRAVPFVLVLISGGPVNIKEPLLDFLTPSILLAGYASQSTGDALAHILLGRYAPAGKLAVSWMEDRDVPDFADMHVLPNASSGSPGRTYRYSTARPLLPFGHGLGYSKFAFSAATVLPSGLIACGGARVSVTVSNTGSVDSSEVVQLYLTFDAAARVPDAAYPAPQVALAGFERVFVAAGGQLEVTLALAPQSYARVNGTAAASFGQDFSSSSADFGLGVDYAETSAKAIGWDDLWALVPGTVSVWVGSGQPGFGAPGVATSFVVGPQLTNLAACT